MNSSLHSASRPGFKRRSLLQSGAALGLLGLAGCASTAGIPTKAKVVVIGGGYGGATAAKYVRLLSDNKIDVLLIEPQAAFVSCPISNLLLSGNKQLADITTPYAGLTRNHGITVVKDYASAIDAVKKTVTLAGGATIAYDKLVVSPGIELQFGSIEGLKEANASGQILQAWKAGAETVALRKQLEAMPDGGVYAITIPEAPYRCPPGPYERASVVAAYFKAAKPRSKVLILDANPDVTSKGPLFKKVWAEQYKGILEYRGQHKATAVDAKTGTIKFDVQDDVKAQVLNVLPAMRAGTIAVQAGLNNQANQRWCGVNYLTFESTAAKDVHVLGDSIQIAPGMPKSGHMANNHGKVAAAAIVAQLSGWEVNPAPMLTNTCYSFVDNQRVIHVASVHEYVAAEKTFKTVAGSGGVSAGPTELEGTYALSWARNIWADTLV
ncbi:sulfide dehydrogenase (flavocytochrome c), flavoprotein subunit [Polaromonas sp. OV174]|uniref:NAD(P)/FAD-dependent oxidoreductase n=1 Tax=Polaromonas sp. OV174 TaxID=1855300 RepID=UPI0008DF624F|nr:NAD(P)/FAD-dependent oxidoreductase [Polaromonas sp. OV174]SFC76226.1 sulfide dehydrogenase (flavocytochrome c), flavoprotein subunit [Polaromonas sp. OV174]